MKEYTANVILYSCVTLVLVIWAITGHLEDKQKLENQKEITLEAFRDGYVECLEKDDLTYPKILWKKECGIK